MERRRGSVRQEKSMIFPGIRIRNDFNVFQGEEFFFQKNSRVGKGNPR